MNLDKYRDKNNKINDLSKKILPIIIDYNEIYKKLSKEERDVLTFYKGRGYVNINKLLIHNFLDFSYVQHILKKMLKEILPPNENVSLEIIIYYSYKLLTDKIKILDGIINKYKTKNELIVYRGMKCDDLFSRLKINDTFTFKNFLSTSLDINVPIEGFTNDCLLELTLPKETPICYLNWNVNNLKNLLNQDIQGSEFEILLGRNYEFKLTKISKLKIKDYNITWKKIKNKKFRKKEIDVYHFTFVKINHTKFSFKNLIKHSSNIDYQNLIPLLGLDNIHYRNNKKNK
jgi:hypothetical protein